MKNINKAPSALKGFLSKKKTGLGKTIAGEKGGEEELGIDQAKKAAG